MPWPGRLLWLKLIILIATVGPPGIFSEENVGCLYSDRLCLSEEWCYDDYAFGRCLPATGDLMETDIYRYSLDREELHTLKKELQRLFALGYRWSHGYTQCRLQAMLYASKHDLPFEDNSCSHLVDQDLEGALNAMETQDPTDPREVAIVKYAPSVQDPHAKYADEIFYPPINKAAENAALREKILGTNAIDIMDMEDPYANYDKREWVPQMHRRSSPRSVYQMKHYNVPDKYEGSMESDLEFLPEVPVYGSRVYETNDEREQRPEMDKLLTLDENKDVYPLVRYLKKMKMSNEDLQRVLSPEDYEKITSLLTKQKHSAVREDVLNSLIQPITEKDLERIAATYNAPELFQSGWDSGDDREDYPESRIYLDEDDHQEYGSGVDIPNENIFRELKRMQDEEKQQDYEKEEIFRELKNQKKSKSGDQYKKKRYHADKNKFDDKKVFTEGGFLYSPEVLKRKGFINEDNLILHSMMKKIPRGAPHPYPFKLESYDSEDSNSDYVYVGFNKDFKTWKQGQDIIKNISMLLHLEPSEFSNGHVLGNMISFKVLPNTRGLNASQVARRIDSIKLKIEENTGLLVVASGIKDTDKMQNVLNVPIVNNNDFYVTMLLFSGILAALILAALTLLLVRKHIKARDKLHGLARPDHEASKDYQDLCRARMATKGQAPTVENVHGRITSLSKESEQSTSSRSSTSSWSEEPALHNMDISTGHMVLAYMEDHLKNKDRLEQEWVALCAYMAEPCDAMIAMKKENVEKNRVATIVPYDHARVVLNELSNMLASDYINASSITDHDPRNPAYIATQGPLPNTAADFWQLIWEQGAVVIVMLTRLTESGVAMCHRYWPEEGSEMYHIYEVHLVSEHIWCDDYLVRSFYLKNLRTSETRTVTQFHFLSWPESGIPASTKALLEFRRKVNKSYRGRSCPIVVHCSDGAGRTGTYCLIDMVLSRMAKGAKEIDIAATLEHLRDQRPHMVATKQQFEFVLTAVAEEVHAILKALPSQTTPAAQDKG